MIINIMCIYTTNGGINAVHVPLKAGRFIRATLYKNVTGLGAIQTQLVLHNDDMRNW